MTKQQFLKDIAELMEVDYDLTLDSNLQEMDEFDSLVIMSLIAYADKNFSKKISGDSFKNISDVRSLIDIIGADHFE